VNTKAKFEKDPSDGQDRGRLDEDGHLFGGYIFAYLSKKWGRGGDGYVTTSSDNPPQLNWIYVDKDTYGLKYGFKLSAKNHTR